MCIQPQASAWHIVGTQYTVAIFFFFLVILFLFDCAGPSLLCRLVSSCSEQRLLSSCDVQASHGDDFS